MGSIGIVIIHGMGSQSAGFERPLVQRLRAELARREADPDLVRIEAVYWQDILEERQASYLRRASQAHRLEFTWLRRLIVQGMGDPAAYQPFTGSGKTVYDRIHRRVRTAVRRLRGRVSSSDSPLVVLAHSLGAHVMSNYIWDLQRGRMPRPDDKFEAFETFAGFVTFGCNIPLFALAHDPIIPIVFPGRGLAQQVKDAARWWNVFDRDDVLAYPLRSVSRGYELTVDADIEVRVGPFFRGWTPRSHVGYWKSRDLVRRIANLVQSLDRAINS